ncbi:1-(5-phosphoribosyl)-5-[(5-phosphoribosylamino)methylideneamino]imidazole-4-carboxamide isomerase [Hydrogenibacillus sp. N12]|uniref:1-(5-phosphoribosyl)-5-[(5- phosphoribosylamino)methylideneamino]imidazole-4- carboxamide isomerase n=1 Tax=Hydrogenibacillus sp. N12 TaxID=2866627 RepID=UPI001C7CEEE8|nr:1-(5-phosphoribosyl)-5-[(5-phosphoribosylamino)methylideneamino]imidazole-4-carboxamide isomerase [Hydrogenibacillus sp. N12]QZA32781.1 1-(5-phosphoribosyl)-5-[(5-phosphoribosylamino)methylideneamino]imidazole-4-carboxamide isomerase [Hydrogenibacillus sp. N12]
MVTFELYPAVDILGGQAVRLVQGDFEQKTVYGAPEAAAEAFIARGARWLHVVDLDGARSGRPVNVGPIAAIVRRAAARGVRVQVGGGLRTLEDIRRVLALGVARVIVGTAAIEAPDVLATAVREAGEAVAVGVDLRENRVAVRGWAETKDAAAEDVLRRIAAAGVRTVIVTDIRRDGTLAGVDADRMASLARASGLRVIASGGVRSVDDVRRLSARLRDGVVGAVIGKALYAGTLDLAAALQAAAEADPAVGEDSGEEEDGR